MKRKIDELGRIVLPAEMKKEIGLENGSEANIEIEDHKIIITKPNAIDYKAIVDKTIEYVENAIYNIVPKGCGINYNCEYDSEEDFINAMKEQSRLNTLKEILEMVKGIKTN